MPPTFEASLQMYMMNPNTQDKQLKNWAGLQRYCFKNSSLKTDRVEKLEDEGFDWFPGKHQEDQAHWQMVLSGLRIHQLHYPHRHLNAEGKTKVYFWMHWLRYKYQKGTLSQARVADLNAIYIHWHVPPPPPPQGLQQLPPQPHPHNPPQQVMQAHGLQAPQPQVLQQQAPPQQAMVLVIPQPVAFFIAAVAIAMFAIAMFAILVLAFRM